LLITLLGTEGQEDRLAKLMTGTDPVDQASQRIDAIGDSITRGDSFYFSIDPLGYPRKTQAEFQGWPGLLGYILTRQTGVNTMVSNVAHPGDRTTTTVEKRLPGLLKRNNRSDRALILLGTNNSGDFNTTPSGAGCSGSDCDGSFKGELLTIVKSLQDEGRDTVYVGLVPPIWGPDEDTVYLEPLGPLAERNRRILEYNRVIKSEILPLPGVRPGPDFFSCFLTPEANRFSLFKDHIHPNTLGYVMMAVLWRNAITEASTEPPEQPCTPPIYILESLDPYARGHKQDLLAEGDPYYTDEAFTLASIPDELSDGIWVTQANADNGNSESEFLSFDVGIEAVSVYIAYDPTGTPPQSSSHMFTPVVLSSDLTNSDPMVGTFGIVRAGSVTGKVSIGGNKSGPGTDRQQGYVVIVVP